MSSGRKKQNPSQAWRLGWRADVLKIRGGTVQFNPPHKPKPSKSRIQFEPLSIAEDQHIAAANAWWKKISGGSKWILAPMVAQSDKCFRLLCREEGVNVCFTPMYLADRINTGVHDKELMLPDSGDTSTSDIVDHPLVCQIAGNSIESLIAAAKRVQTVVDAIDLNYGCPQRCAEDAGIGAFFLERNPDFACDVVSKLSQALKIPVLVKMRLHADGEEATVRLAHRLQAAGASAITLHARHRWQREHEGPADWSIIRSVKQAVGIPVFANGSVQCLADGLDCIAYTAVDAVMSGTGLLRHPTLFTDIALRSPCGELASGDEVDVTHFTDRRAAYKALRNCYRYLSIVDHQVMLEAGRRQQRATTPTTDTTGAGDMDRCGAVAVNGREGREVIRDHLLAMLQIHVMGVHADLCSRLMSKSLNFSATTECFRETLDLIAARLFMRAPHGVEDVSSKSGVTVVDEGLSGGVVLDGGRDGSKLAEDNKKKKKKKKKDEDTGENKEEERFCCPQCENNNYKDTSSTRSCGNIICDDELLCIICTRRQK
jgi:tRNA-dihydrouridine synthase